MAGPYDNLTSLDKTLGIATAASSAIPWAPIISTAVVLP